MPLIQIFIGFLRYAEGKIKKGIEVRPIKIVHKPKRI